ncbi:MAG TPA: glucokinase [Verrucomicrobiae bacterium]|jgi:glucokinase|nr:glucokinase [Verrucomicrobiae bacterium]
MILAGDIGGTKVNVAFFGDSFRLDPDNLASYPSRDYASLSDIAHKFLSERKLKADYACFGIAGPIKKGRVAVTNLPWVVTDKDLKQSLNLKHVWLINDLEANAHGIRGLTAKDFVTLNKGEEGAIGNAAIISAGTGLGEAGLFWDGNRHLPVASEGGHSDFAPRTDLDIELSVYLRKRFGQVDWEAVLSGPGQYHIYEFLRQRKGDTEPAWLAAEMRSEEPPKVVTRTALEGKDDVCVQALNLFVDYYGAEAANLALKVLATGGVYIGGGIAPKIITKLNDGRFMKAFIGEGRMKNLLAAMPVCVIMNDKTALIGAARFAAMQSGRIL